MSQRTIAVGLALFALATIGFSSATYWQVNEARKEAVAATALATDAATIAERARRESSVAQSAVPAIATRVTHLEEQTTALRETLLAIPAITVNGMRPLKNAVDELVRSVAEVRSEVQRAQGEASSATTAARAANAKAGAAYSVAAEARDVAVTAYNIEAGTECVKILGELAGQQKELASLTKDMQRIRDLGRDRRPVSGDYDDLFMQSLKLEFAMAQNVATYNAIAKELGAEFMERYGLPAAITTAADKSK